METSVNLNTTFDEPSYVDRLDLVEESDAGAFELGTWGVADVDVVLSAGVERGLTPAYVSGLVGSINDPSRLEASVREIRAAIETAEEYGCDCLNVSANDYCPGRNTYVQRKTAITILRDVAEAAEDADVTLLLEPLNPVDHPESFVDSFELGYDIVRSVDSPNVRVLFDWHHAQFMPGSLVENIRSNSEMIGHVHVASAPDRQTPGTGELNPQTLLSELSVAGYDGYVGCEFEPTGAPIPAINRVVDMVARVR